MSRTTAPLSDSACRLAKPTDPPISFSLSAPSPLGTRALPRMKYPKDLKAIAAYPIGDEIGPIGHRPFTRFLTRPSRPHSEKPGQFVYAGENRI
ncbi:MAG: hypothetical protein JWR17_1984 [Pseudomonas sp.]|nr:hypothetical protein [Pseudomonas sp.]